MRSKSTLGPMQMPHSRDNTFGMINIYNFMLSYPLLIKDHVAQFYKLSLTKDMEQRPKLDELAFETIEENKVHEVVGRMARDKAPSFDGLFSNSIGK